MKKKIYSLLFKALFGSLLVCFGLMSADSFFGIISLVMLISGGLLVYKSRLDLVADYFKMHQTPLLTKIFEMV